MLSVFLLSGSWEPLFIMVHQFVNFPIILLYFKHLTCVLLNNLNRVILLLNSIRVA